MFDEREEAVAPPGPEPLMAALERLHSEITTQAAHLHAATCRFLLCLAEWDRRGGWATFGARSPAHYLSWACGIGISIAREMMKVAIRLPDLPLVTEAFSSGVISFSKAALIARVATPSTEEELLRYARSSTASQLARLVGAYRQALEAEGLAEPLSGAGRRYLSTCFDEDGFFVLRARLLPEEGALLERALAAAAQRLRGAPATSVETDSDRLAETPPGLAWNRPGARRADALVAIADSALANDLAARSSAERYQVVVHVAAPALAGGAPGPAEIEAGPAIPTETARRIACDATKVVVADDAAGHPLSVGRRSRVVPPAMRRALRARDRGCRFPGCPERRFVQAHHLHHWAKGGETALSNLLELCSFHHRLHHEGGYGIAGSPEEGLTFLRPGGRPIPPVPPAPSSPGDLAGANAAMGLAIGPDTCIPDWWGDRMDYGEAVGGLVDLEARSRKQAGAPP